MRRPPRIRPRRPLRRAKTEPFAQRRGGLVLDHGGADRPARRRAHRRPAPARCSGPASRTTWCKCLDRLYRQRRIDLQHARILRIWGERRHARRTRAPRARRGDSRLWREAMERLDWPLRAKGIVAGASPAPVGWRGVVAFPGGGGVTGASPRTGAPRRRRRSGPSSSSAAARTSPGCACSGRGFRHCFAALEDAAGWTVLDPLVGPPGGGPARPAARLRPAGASTAAPASPCSARSCRAGRAGACCRRFAPFSCVALCRAVLGADAPFARDALRPVPRPGAAERN